MKLALTLIILAASGQALGSLRDWLRDVTVTETATRTIQSCSCNGEERVITPIPRDEVPQPFGNPGSKNGLLEPQWGRPFPSAPGKVIIKVEPIVVVYISARSTTTRTGLVVQYGPTQGGRGPRITKTIWTGPLPTNGWNYRTHTKTTTIHGPAPTVPNNSPWSDWPLPHTTKSSTQISTSSSRSLSSSESTTSSTSNGGPVGGSTTSSSTSSSTGVGTSSSAASTITGSSVTSMTSSSSTIGASTTSASSTTQINSPSSSTSSASSNSSSSSSLGPIEGSTTSSPTSGLSTLSTSFTPGSASTSTSSTSTSTSSDTGPTGGITTSSSASTTESSTSSASVSASSTPSQSSTTSSASASLATSSTSLTTTSTSSSVPSSSTSVPGAVTTDDVSSLSAIDAILEAHNVHRRNHSAADLTWSGSLASIAASIAATCVYGHNTDAGGGGYGQNIGAGYTPERVPSMIGNSMYNSEMPNYPQPYGVDNPDMSHFDDWGHFSQIVWKDTKEVGCATQNCPNVLGGYFTVCNYSPPGNIQGAYSQVGAPLQQPIVVISPV